MTHFFVALQKIILNVINIRLELFSLFSLHERFRLYGISSKYRQPRATVLETVAPSNCIHVNKSNDKGFSLIEIIIVIALLAVVASFSSLYSTDSISRSYALAERDLLVSLLTQTRTKALSNINAQPHSLYIDTNTYVMYEGTTYNALNPTNRVIPKISNAIVQGLDTITFQQLTANTATVGTIHIISDMETYDIEVNGVGRINW